METENQIQKIYGLIGYGLLAYYHYYHNTHSSPLVLYGYLVLTFAFIPWYFNSEIKHKIETKKELESEEKMEKYIDKIGHSLISIYYASVLIKKFDVYALLGLVGNFAILTQYKRQAIIILIGYYLLSIIQSHGSIGSMALILFYYYQLEKS